MSTLCFIDADGFPSQYAQRIIDIAKGQFGARIRAFHTKDDVRNKINEQAFSEWNQVFSENGLVLEACQPSNNAKKLAQFHVVIECMFDVFPVNIRNINRVVIVSGGPDFFFLVKKLQVANIEVIVIGKRSMYNENIRFVRSCDRFLFIECLCEENTIIPIHDFLHRLAVISTSSLLEPLIPVPKLEAALIGSDNTYCPQLYGCSMTNEVLALASVNVNEGMVSIDDIRNRVVGIVPNMRAVSPFKNNTTPKNSTSNRSASPKTGKNVPSSPKKAPKNNSKSEEDGKKPSKNAGKKSDGPPSPIASRNRNQDIPRTRERKPDGGNGQSMPPRGPRGSISPQPSRRYSSQSLLHLSLAFLKSPVISTNCYILSSVHHITHLVSTLPAILNSLNVPIVVDFLYSSGNVPFMLILVTLQTILFVHLPSDGSMPHILTEFFATKKILKIMINSSHHCTTFRSINFKSIIDANILMKYLYFSSLDVLNAPTAPGYGLFDFLASFGVSMTKTFTEKSFIPGESFIGSEADVWNLSVEPFAMSFIVSKMFLEIQPQNFKFLLTPPANEPKILTCPLLKKPQSNVQHVVQSILSRFDLFIDHLFHYCTGCNSMMYPFQNPQTCCYGSATGFRAICRHCRQVFDFPSQMGAHFNCCRVSCTDFPTTYCDCGYAVVGNIAFLLKHISEHVVHRDLKQIFDNMRLLDSDQGFLEAVWSLTRNVCQEDDSDNELFFSSI
ncbi:hypothetical protein RCL1_006353 [Eukaryota sp. TZLM3-RCL]